VRSRSEYDTRLDRQRLAELEHETAALRRRFADAGLTVECDPAHSAGGWKPEPGWIPGTASFTLDDVGGRPHADELSELYLEPGPSGEADPADAGAPWRLSDQRTEVLVNHGRRSTYTPGLPAGYKLALGAAVAAVLVTISVITLSGGGASWPRSVAIVQDQAARACQNADVKSEPGQVNFACAKATRQILWVFALLTSGDNPNFADRRTGRVGLEPITPTQGGEVAWSLNLHHPYNPAHPVDSIEVAARAINNIIGGATVTGADGNPVVQSGLESSRANCLRYTGSAAVTSHAGFPPLCAKPVATPAGQAALVADVYQKWVVGAASEAAQDAAVLFENAANPGDPRVQAILKRLETSRP
jgi:hypothetical protein